MSQPTLQAIQLVYENELHEKETAPSSRIFHLSFYSDPSSGKDILLWDDIMDAFKDDIVHVRRGTMILPFLKGSNFKNLEPLRIAADPSTTLSVVVRGSQSDDDAMSLESLKNALPRTIQEDIGNNSHSSSKNISAVVSITSTTITKRNPISGLVEEAMENYNHMVKPLSVEPVPTQIILQKHSQEQPEQHIQYTSSTPTTITTAIAVTGRNPVYGSEEEAMANYAHISESDTVVNMPSLMIQECPLDEQQAGYLIDTKVNNSNTFAFVTKRNPAIGSEEDAMANYSHMDNITSSPQHRGPQALITEGSVMEISKTKLHDGITGPYPHAPQQDPSVIAISTVVPVQDFVQTMIIAKRGDVQAQNSLGEMYKYGHEVYQDYQAAMDWCLLAANQGHARAQFNVGDLHEHGNGVPQDFAEAIKWFTKAAVQGDPEAQCSIGTLYKYGRGVPKDNHQAMQWLLMAADQDLARAQFHIGDMYSSDNDFARDNIKAAEWLTKAAVQGNPEAQCSLGNFYANGRGVHQSYSEAMKWYLEAAEQNYIHAQFNIGSMYRLGQGVHENGYQALLWYRKAADQGDTLSQLEIGHLYQQGRGVVRNISEAMNWFRKAADQGNADAQCTLGWMFWHAQDVPQNFGRAMEWYRKAADQENAGAQYNIGVMYHKGLGVPIDKKSAMEWYKKAADNGHADAGDCYKILKTECSELQEQEVQRNEIVV
ncbi:hypothetical protein FBU30_008918 [Linnemannia zychae]|nr:hypothetical protein FBU30_008918 [Linnemannia zychae]